MAIDINIPSQVKNYANLAGFPATGALKTIYIANDTNKTYRWTGSAYVEISGTDTSSLVPTSRTLTINGTTQDLSADRTFTISTGITIGTTAITSGTNGRFLFDDAGVVSETNGAFWDNTNGRLGIGGTPVCKVQIITNNFTTTPPWSYDNTISQLAGATNQGLLATYSSTLGSFIGSVFPGNAWLNITYVANNHIFSIAGTEAMRIASPTRNVLINTTTDAGFKLDVNGTARVQTSIQSPSVVAGATNGFGFALWVGSTARFEGGANFGAVGTIIHSGTSMFFNNISTGDMIFRTSTNVERMRIGATTGSILIGTTSELASSLLTIDSTTKGFLPPRMTTTQKNAIASPATGLMVYDTTLNLMALYNGTTWTTL
jgi:hypothetical protein